MSLPLRGCRSQRKVKGGKDAQGGGGGSHEPCTGAVLMLTTGWMLSESRQCTGQRESYLEGKGLSIELQDVKT